MIKGGGERVRGSKGGLGGRLYWEVDELLEWTTNLNFDE